MRGGGRNARSRLTIRQPNESSARHGARPRANLRGACIPLGSITEEVVSSAASQELVSHAAHSLESQVES